MLLHTYYSPAATAILNEIPACLGKIKYWICSSKQAEKKSSLFFRSSTLLSSNSNKCPCFTARLEHWLINANDSREWYINIHIHMNWFETLSITRIYEFFYWELNAWYWNLRFLIAYADGGIYWISFDQQLCISFRHHSY